MTIIPGVLGEAEICFFEDEDYEALAGVLDDVLARHLLDYMNNPLSNVIVVDYMQQALGKVIEDLTLHYVFREKGVLDVVAHTTPEAVASMHRDYDSVLEILEYLDENFHRVRMVLTARKSADFDRFYDSICKVTERMADANYQTTFPNIRERVMANKFIFYKPGEKDSSTGMGLLASRERDWKQCLNGLRFKKYCDENNINYLKRRVF